MKARVLILTLSLLLNLGLAVRAWQVRDQRPVRPTAMAAPASSTGPRHRPDVDGGAQGRTKPRTVWDHLRATDDLPGLVAQLRAAGCPPYLLRSIVEAELQHQAGPRRAAIVAERDSPPYWQTGRYSTTDPELALAWRKLHVEQQERLRELLGSEAVAADPYQSELRRRQYGPLSEEAIEKLETIRSDYMDLRAEIHLSSRAILLPADREKLAFLDREERADLKAALSAGELLEYELRQSQTAQRLRQELAPFAPNEDEYRRAFFALRVAEESRPNTGSSSLYRLSDAERAALRQQLQAQLAPERFAEFEQATDPAQAGLNHLMMRLNLPVSTSREVTAVATDISRRAHAIRNSRELDQAQRQAQLLALSQEATNRLTQTLGEAGLAAYRNFGGQWLAGLTAPPAPTPDP